MSDKVSILQFEDGHILINMYGRKFISKEPVKLIDGKFRASVINGMIFVEE